MTGMGVVLDVECYRAIRGERLELSPVTVLVGRNGSGKTSLAEAAFMSVSVLSGHLTWDERFSYGEIAGKRYPSGTLVHRGCAGARIEARTPWGEAYLTVSPEDSSPRRDRLFCPRILGMSFCSEHRLAGPRPSVYAVFQQGPPGLEEAYERAVGALERDGLTSAYRAAVLAATRLSVNAPVVDRAVVYVEKDGYRIPYRALGRGEQSLLLMLAGIVLAARGDALVVLEEPESSLHPSLLDALADAVARAASARNSFIVVTTHSLELVSLFAEKLSGERGVLSLALLYEGGVHHVFRGGEAAEALSYGLDVRGL